MESKTVAERSDGGILALDPTSGPLERKERRGPAARPETLNGVVVGLVSNGLGRSDLFMQTLYDELKHLAEPAGTVKVTKLTVSNAPTKEDWQRLTSQATVAITGMGG